MAAAGTSVVDLSPHGKFAVLGTWALGSDASLNIADTATGRTVHTLLDFGKGMYCFDPADGMLAIMTDDCDAVRGVALPSGCEIFSCALDVPHCRILAWSPSGSMIALARDDRIVRLHAAHLYRKRQSADLGINQLLSRVLWDNARSNFTSATTADAASAMVVLNTCTGRTLAIAVGCEHAHKHNLHASFDPTGRHIVVTSQSWQFGASRQAGHVTASVFVAASGLCCFHSTSERALDQPYGSSHWSAAWSPNGRFLLMHRQSQVADQALQVVSTASWQQVAAIRAEANIESLVWALDSRHIAIHAIKPFGDHVSVFSFAP